MTTQAERLAHARHTAGYRTPTDAARAFGWAWPTYYSHENGNRGLTPKAAVKYGRAFRVSPAWLLIGEGGSELAPMGQAAKFDRDLIAVAIESLLNSLVPGIVQEEAEQLSEAVLRLIELQQRRGRTETDLENLRAAVAAVAKLAEPRESE